MSKYDVKNWTYKEYITEPLDNFPITGIVMKLSGGADSSIVYYRLCTEIAKRGLDYPLYVVTLDPETKDWYSHYAKKVIEFTKNRTGIKPLEHRIRKLPLPWGFKEYANEQDEILHDIFRENLANVSYGGLTKNPDPKLQATIASKVSGIKLNYEECLTESKSGSDPDRLTNDKKYAIGYGKPNNVDVPNYLAILPFVHKDKKQGTAEMYKEMGVIDELLPLTYSCEEYRTSEKTKLTVVDNYQEYSHCGKCWFCLERAYAFGRLT